MALFPVLLFLAAVLLPFFPANGQQLLGGLWDPGHPGLRLEVFPFEGGEISQSAQNTNFAALSTTHKEVQKEIVKKHNDLRRTVSPPAGNMLKMQWDSKAAENAQKWANECTLEHSLQEARKVGQMECGENLFMSSMPVSWSRAIQRWFDEGNNFIYGSGPKQKNMVVGHYTQVAWYSSYLVGCGIAYCPKEQTLKYYYVCHYCPGGNVVGRTLTPYLKGTPCASCPNNCDQGLCTNPCEYEDIYSNCNDLKSQLGCENDFVKTKCKASCNCSKKIY